jgi:hypothetical protein
MHLRTHVTHAQGQGAVKTFRRPYGRQQRTPTRSVQCSAQETCAVGGASHNTAAARCHPSKRSAAAQLGCTHATSSPQPGLGGPHAPHMVACALLHTATFVCGGRGWCTHGPLLQACSRSSQQKRRRRLSCQQVASPTATSAQRSINGHTIAWQALCRPMAMNAQASRRVATSQRATARASTTTQAACGIRPQAGCARLTRLLTAAGVVLGHAAATQTHTCPCSQSSNQPTGWCWDQNCM